MSHPIKANNILLLFKHVENLSSVYHRLEQEHEAKKSEIERMKQAKKSLQHELNEVKSSLNKLQKEIAGNSLHPSLILCLSLRTRSLFLRIEVAHS